MVTSDSYIQGSKSPMWRRGAAAKTRSRKNSFPWAARREMAANWSRNPESRRTHCDSNESDSDN